jgi:putative tryptophan/tyrosine transport system substrate-binding protein
MARSCLPESLFAGALEPQLPPPGCIPSIVNVIHRHMRKQIAPSEGEFKVSGGRRLCLLVAPLLVCEHSFGQISQRSRKVGVLAQTAADAEGEDWNAFIGELSRRGYVEGRNLVFEKRFGGQHADGLRRAATELASLKVELIYAAGGSSSALAAKAASGRVPIVFQSSNDPVSVGLVASLAHPGGKITGSATRASAAMSKSLEVLRDVAPTLRSVAFLHQTGTHALPWYENYRADVLEAGRALSLNIGFHDLPPSMDAGDLLPKLIREGVGGVAILYGVNTVPDSGYERLAEQLVRFKLPSIGDPQLGFLLFYGFSEELVARMAAEYVDRVLRGQSPSELPVRQVELNYLTISVRTADRLGVNFPTSVLVRAEKIVR